MYIIIFCVTDQYNYIREDLSIAHRENCVTDSTNCEPATQLVRVSHVRKDILVVLIAQTTNLLLNSWPHFNFHTLTGYFLEDLWLHYFGICCQMERNDKRKAGMWCRLSLFRRKIYIFSEKFHYLYINKKFYVAHIFNSFKK